MSDLLGLLVLQLFLGALAATFVVSLGSARSAPARDILQVWIIVFLFVGFLPISLVFCTLEGLFRFARACWRNE
jgi:hypothetical protein